MAEQASFDALRRNAAARRRAIELLWQLDGRPDGPRRGNLFAIMDAARDPRIYPGLRRLAASEQVIGLYQGPTARELASVAPYIVSLGVTDLVFDWIWNNGWGDSWGVFFWSLVSTETLRAHFRRLTMVRGPDGRQLLFRFYDPRVLRLFAPSCAPDQIREVFGPVARYMIEDEDGAAIIVAEPGVGGQVITDRKILIG